MLKFMKIVIWKVFAHLAAFALEGTERKRLTRRISYRVRLKSHHVGAARQGTGTSQLAVVRVANNWEPRVAA